jgi:hypothetical protein
MISTVKELIEELKQLNPDEVLVYTYWGDEDYKSYKDPDQVISLIDDALDNCVGHVNDHVESQYQDEDEDEE